MSSLDGASGSLGDMMNSLQSKPGSGEGAVKTIWKYFLWRERDEIIKGRRTSSYPGY